MRDVEPLTRRSDLPYKVRRVFFLLTGMSRANLSLKCGINIYTCVITMQHTAEVNESCFLMARMSADGVMCETIHALTFANNVHIHHEQKREFQGHASVAKELSSGPTAL